MKYIWALLGVLVFAPVWADNLLVSDTVKINSDELRYYFEDRLPPDAKAFSLSQTKTYREALENIYLIKHFSALAKKENVIGEKEHWVAELELSRVLMKFYVQSYINNRFKQVDWDALAHEEYLVNKKEYIEEEKVSASHILIKTSGKSEQDALTEAQRILVELGDGANFNELARKYSEDKGSAKLDGSLGYFTRKMMVKPFSDAAFALEKNGDISSLVKTIFGFHIIRLDDRKVAGLAPFDEVKERVVTLLKEKLRAKLHKDLIFEARSSKDFTIDQKSVDQFKKIMEAENPLPKLEG